MAWRGWPGAARGWAPLGRGGVPAAAGGVGVFLVQMGKLAGARVIATASTEEKRELARSLGGDETIDYTQAEWPQAARAATGGRGADGIAATVGGGGVPGGPAW